MDTDKKKYQYEFSDMHKDVMYNSDRREQKAQKTIAVIQDCLKSVGKESRKLSLLDIGCSTGYMTKLYSSYFKEVTGIDIDQNAVKYAQENNSDESVKFQIGNAMDVDFPSNSFDVITCSHIYEHVPDAKRLLSEIYRVLKPKGFCYFAAGNRLNFMEAHYRLPLLSIIPKPLAHHYIRLAGKADFYYETHLSLWDLKKLVRKFELIDYTLDIIRDPVKYSATEMVSPDSIRQKIFLVILKFAYWSCPTYRACQVFS